MGRFTRKGFLSLTTVVFFFTQCAWAHLPETGVWAERKKNAEKQYAFLNLNASSLTNVIPAEAGIQALTLTEMNVLDPGFRRDDDPNCHLDLQKYGSLRKITNFKSQSTKSKTIIHIQDVHLNPEAQTNISRAIQTLIDKDHVDLIALEGAFKPIELDVVRRFPYKDSTRHVADYLLRENKISGAVHRAMISEGSLPHVVGIDDHRHYYANVNAYKKAAAISQQQKEELAIKRAQLNTEKTAIFSPSLKAFDDAVQAYTDGQVSLGAHVQFLSQHAKMLSPQIELFLQAWTLESQIDFSRIENERTRLIHQLVQKLAQEDQAALINLSLAYRTGNIRPTAFYGHIKALCEKNDVSLSRYPIMNSYLQYVVLTNAIDVERLLQEIKELEQQGYASLVRNETEKRLVQESRYLRLVGKLLDFALTKEEWEEYRTSFSVLRTSSKENNLQIGDLSLFESFYLEAEIRDQKMAENFINHLHSAKYEERSTKYVSILVTGGFHAKGITGRLTAAGFTVISFVPKITKVETGNGSAYLSVFTQEKTALDQLFEGKTLFLPPLVAPENMGGVQLLQGLHSLATRQVSSLDELRGHQPSDVPLNARVEIAEEGGNTTVSLSGTRSEVELTVERTGRVLRVNKRVKAGLVILGVLIGIVGFPNFAWGMPKLTEVTVSVALIAGVDWTSPFIMVPAFIGGAVIVALLLDWMLYRKALKRGGRPFGNKYLAAVTEFPYFIPATLVSAAIFGSYFVYGGSGLSFSDTAFSIHSYLSLGAAALSFLFLRGFKEIHKQRWEESPFYYLLGGTIIVWVVSMAFRISSVFILHWVGTTPLLKFAALALAYGLSNLIVGILFHLFLNWGLKTPLSSYQEPEGNGRISLPLAPTTAPAPQPIPQVNPSVNKDPSSAYPINRSWLGAMFVFILLWALSTFLPIFIRHLPFPEQIQRTKIVYNALKGLDGRVRLRAEFLNYLSAIMSPAHYGPAKYESLVTKLWEDVNRIAQGEMLLLPPTYFEIHPTERCNLECRHCRGNPDKGIPGLRYIPEEQLDIGIKRMHRIVEDLHYLNPDVFVRILGTIGEPLVYPHIADLFERLNEKRMGWGLVTNGVLLGRTVFKNSERVFRALMSSTFVHVSLDETNNEDYLRYKGGQFGDYDRVILGLKRLVKLKRETGSKTKIAVSILLKESNSKKGQILELSRLLKEIGVDQFQIKTLHYDSRQTVEEEALRRGYREARRAQKRDPDKSYQVVMVQEEDQAILQARGERPTIDFPRCYVHQIGGAGVATARGFEPCCEHYVGAIGRWGDAQAELREAYYSDLRKEILERDPRDHGCVRCSPSDEFVNRFVNLLRIIHELDPTTYHWAKEKFVRPYNRLKRRAPKVKPVHNGSPTRRLASSHNAPAQKPAPETFSEDVRESLALIFGYADRIVQISEQRKREWENPPAGFNWQEHRYYTHIFHSGITAARLRAVSEGLYAVANYDGLPTLRELIEKLAAVAPNVPRTYTDYHEAINSIRDELKKIDGLIPPAARMSILPRWLLLKISGTEESVELYEMHIAPAWESTVLAFIVRGVPAGLVGLGLFLSSYFEIGRIWSLAVVLTSLALYIEMSLALGYLVSVVLFRRAHGWFKTLGEEDKPFVDRAIGFTHWISEAISLVMAWLVYIVLTYLSDILIPLTGAAVFYQVVLVSVIGVSSLSYEISHWAIHWYHNYTNPSNRRMSTAPNNNGIDLNQLIQFVRKTYGPPAPDDPRHIAWDPRTEWASAYDEFYDRYGNDPSFLLPPDSLYVQALDPEGQLNDFKGKGVRIYLLPGLIRQTHDKNLLIGHVEGHPAVLIDLGSFVAWLGRSTRKERHDLTGHILDAMRKPGRVAPPQLPVYYRFQEAVKEVPKAAEAREAWSARAPEREARAAREEQKTRARLEARKKEMEEKQRQHQDELRKKDEQRHAQLLAQAARERERQQQAEGRKAKRNLLHRLKEKQRERRHKIQAAEQEKLRQRAERLKFEQLLEHGKKDQLVRFIVKLTRNPRRTPGNWFVIGSLRQKLHASGYTLRLAPRHVKREIRRVRRFARRIGKPIPIHEWTRDDIQMIVEFMNAPRVRSFLKEIHAESEGDVKKQWIPKESLSKVDELRPDKKLIAAWIASEENVPLIRRLILSPFIFFADVFFDGAALAITILKTPLKVIGTILASIGSAAARGRSATTIIIGAVITSLYLFGPLSSSSRAEQVPQLVETAVSEDDTAKIVASIISPINDEDPLALDGRQMSYPKFVEEAEDQTLFVVVLDGRDSTEANEAFVRETARIPKGSRVLFISPSSDGALIQRLKTDFRTQTNLHFMNDPMVRRDSAGDLIMNLSKLEMYLEGPNKEDLSLASFNTVRFSSLKSFDVIAPQRLSDEKLERALLHIRSINRITNILTRLLESAAKRREKKSA